MIYYNPIESSQELVMGAFFDYLFLEINTLLLDVVTCCLHPITSRGCLKSEPSLNKDIIEYL